MFMPHAAIVDTHCAYPRRNGQAELMWVAARLGLYKLYTDIVHPRIDGRLQIQILSTAAWSRPNFVDRTQRVNQ